MRPLLSNNYLLEKGNILKVSAPVAFSGGLYAYFTPDSFMTGAQTSNFKQFAKQMTHVPERVL